MILIGLALGACSNSGLGQNTDTEPDPSATDLATCALAGTWQLDMVRCGAFDVTPDWLDTFDSARLEIVGNAAQGGCDVTRVLVGPDCDEIERMRWVPTSDGAQVDVMSDGVRVCEPVGCAFDVTRDCVVGDRAELVDQLGMDLDTGAGTLRVTDGQPDGSLVAMVPDCTLEVVTGWSRQ